MCRLAMFNRTFFDNNPGQVAEMLWDLETSMGGDGNGVACLLPTGETLMEKGLDVNPSDCYDILEKWLETTDATWFLFHTRIATSGGKSDKMCHPFREKEMVLAHNGVCSSFAGFKVNGRLVSDTRFLLHVATSYTDNALETLMRASGVFIGFLEGKPYVVKASGTSDLHILLSVKAEDRYLADGICFTSEFTQPIPFGYRLYSTKIGIWQIPDVLSPIMGHELKNSQLKKYITDRQYENLPRDIQKSYYQIKGKNKEGVEYSYYIRSTVVSDYSENTTNWYE